MGIAVAPPLSSRASTHAYPGWGLTPLSDGGLVPLQVGLVFPRVKADVSSFWVLGVAGVSGALGFAQVILSALLLPAACFLLFLLPAACYRPAIACSRCGRRRTCHGPGLAPDCVPAFFSVWPYPAAPLPPSTP